MTTPDDRRRDERTAPDGPTPSSPAAPLVVDLSVGGCSVLLERDKELGEEVTVGIRLSDEDLDDLNLLGTANPPFGVFGEDQLDGDGERWLAVDSSTGNIRALPLRWDGPNGQLVAGEGARVAHL